MPSECVLLSTSREVVGCDPGFWYFLESVSRDA